MEEKDEMLNVTSIEVLITLTVSLPDLLLLDLSHSEQVCSDSVVVSLSVASAVGISMPHIPRN